MLSSGTLVSLLSMIGKYFKCSQTSNCSDSSRAHFCIIQYVLLCFDEVCIILCCFSVYYCEALKQHRIKQYINNTDLTTSVWTVVQRSFKNILLWKVSCKLKDNKVASCSSCFHRHTCKCSRVHQSCFWHVSVTHVFNTSGRFWSWPFLFHQSVWCFLPTEREIFVIRERCTIFTRVHRRLSHQRLRNFTLKSSLNHLSEKNEKCISMLWIKTPRQRSWVSHWCETWRVWSRTVIITKANPSVY